jgi:hypothetical protein
MSEQLNMETAKCRQLEEKNMVLQHCLKDLLEHNCVLVEKQTVAVVQQSFSDFQNFITKLRNAGYVTTSVWRRMDLNSRLMQTLSGNSGLVL